MPDRRNRPVASRRALEIGVALLIIAFGALVAWDSWRVGARWAEDGPQSGYFPFYVGVLICVSGLATLVSAAAQRAMAKKPFVTFAQLRLVLAMLIPTIAYVVLIRLIGIYIASALFIGLFMMWLGRYGWLKTVAVSAGVSGAAYLLFETWFHVPLPKGPLEALLGLN